MKNDLALKKVKETIARYDMLKAGDRVLVGVSGGPDSMALLHILNALRKEYNLKLFVAHLNHMIRKTDAQKDAAFVRKTAEKLNLPVVIETKDVPKMAKERRRSLEEAARDARYEFYLNAAQEFRANKIALGHTEDDQAETVLMRLIRGAGLLGLSGMPPVRGFADKKIIRPLIEVSKDEIKKFLKKSKILFRIDKTNIQPIYLRNKIRHKLIPILEKEFNPEIKKILKETARNVRIDYDFISKIGEKKFKKYWRTKKRLLRPDCVGARNDGDVGARNDGCAQIDLKFLDEDVAVQRLIFREAIRRIKGNLEAVTYRHWEDLEKLLKRPGRWKFILPGGVIIKKTGATLVFGRQFLKTDKDLKGVRYDLVVPGKIKVCELNKAIKADFVKQPVDFRRKKSKNVEYFDFDKLRLPLLVRFRGAGDRIRPLGMVHYKRIKQVFIDEKVPYEKRARVPLIFSGDELIWVVGIRRADFAKVSDATEKIISLKYG